MRMFKFFCSVLLVLSSMWLTAAEAAKVVFLNPGLSTETFWVSYSKFMAAAADDLGMTLQVRYSERDPDKTLIQAREALQGPDRPDYLVFVNELYAAPEILRLSQGSGVKLFAVNNTLTPDQINILGDVRTRFPNLIGSLVGNDEEGGYLMAKELIRLHPKVAVGQSIDMLAFSGAATTPVAQLREQGLHRALAEHPEVHLRQLVYSGWERGRAQEQARQLFKRYPKTSLVWSANDEMAFGAMAALRERGAKPGKDVLFSALNSSTAALQARLDGSLSVLAGGHFTLGGWAMVLLHDYDATREQDRQYLGARQLSVLQLIGQQDARRLLQASYKDDYGVDFRTFSVTGNPTPDAYHFSLKSILH